MREMKTKEREELEKDQILNDIHIRWLSKAKTSMIDGNEMTVLPYGYLTQAVEEVLDRVYKEIKRLDERDGNARIFLLTPTDNEPFLREELKIVDFGVADNHYIVERKYLLNEKDENKERD